MMRLLRRLCGYARWDDLSTAERLFAAALYRTNLLKRGVS